MEKSPDTDQGHFDHGSTTQASIVQDDQPEALAAAAPHGQQPHQPSLPTIIYTKFSSPFKFNYLSENDRELSL